MRKILFVDDEPNVLSGLKRMLSRKRKIWEMHFAESGEDALSIMETVDDFDIVISDMRMPKMQGYELLEIVAERWPNVSRLILSGHAEHESALRAAGIAHQFLSKPCDPQEIELAVVRTCTMRDRLNETSIAGAVTGLGSLPALPQSYGKLVAELNVAEPSLDRISDIIESDVAMSVKVLQLVNSSYFGMPRQIDGIRQAAALLGLDTLRDLAVSTSVFRALDGKVDECEMEQLWQRGKAVSSLTATICLDIEADDITRSELRIAGFVHDVGRIALGFLAPGKIAEVRQSVADGADLIDAERNIFNADHATIGAYVLGTWGLPEKTVEAVFYHHDPKFDERERSPHSWVIGLSVALVEAAEIRTLKSAPDWAAIADMHSAQAGNWAAQAEANY